MLSETHEHPLERAPSDKPKPPSLTSPSASISESQTHSNLMGRLDDVLNVVAEPEMNKNKNTDLPHPMPFLVASPNKVTHVASTASETEIEPETDIEKYIRLARATPAPLLPEVQEPEWSLVMKFNGKIRTLVKKANITLASFCWAFCLDQFHEELMDTVITIKQRREQVVFGLDSDSNPTKQPEKLLEESLSLLPFSPHYDAAKGRLFLDGQPVSFVSAFDNDAATGLTKKLKTEAVITQSVSIKCPLASHPCELQLIFSCWTCRNARILEGANVDIQLGVCGWCRLSCHSGHQGVIVGQRRNFNCECNEEQVINQYDECFQDIFCYCQKPRGDGVLIPCLICENQFHAGCIVDCASTHHFDQFACSTCTSRLTFLVWYSHLTDNFLTGGDSDSLIWEDGWNETGPRKRGTLTPQHIDPICKIGTLRHAKVNGDPHVYLIKGWRQALCQCFSCMIMYKTEDVLHLME